MKPRVSRWRQTSVTAGCSTLLITMWRPSFRRAVAAPIRAWLLASVPPLVKMTSAGVAPQEMRHLQAGPVDGLSAFAPGGVAAAGVAETAGQDFLHGFSHPAVQGRGRVISR